MNVLLRRIDEARILTLERMLQDHGLRGHVGPSLVVRTALVALSKLSPAAIVKLAIATSAERDEEHS